MAPLLRDYVTKEAGIYFEKVCQILELEGVNFVLDDFLVRGLDYYSHTAFEIKAITGPIKDAIGGGGRYDKLLGMFGGPDISGMGFAFGAERVMENMPTRQKSPLKTAVIAVSEGEDMEAFEIVRSLQECNIISELIHANNVQKKFKIADRIGSDIAIVIGENEKKDQTVALKFLRNQSDKKSHVIKRKNLIKFILNSVRNIDFLD